MNYTLHIDVEHRFIRQTWHGPVTVSALLALWRELAADPRGIAEFDTLIDLRASTVSLSPSEILSLADVAKQQPPSQRAVVTHKDSDFGLMRMLELSSEPGPRAYAVFRTIEEACTWLGNTACGA